MARQGTREPIRGRRRASLVLVPFIAVAIGAVVVGDTSSAPADVQVHLTAAGDYGARTETATVLQRVAQLGPDAHLALGDLAYRDVTPETAWCSYVKSRVGEGFPFQLVSGNHESLDQADGLINNYGACLPNQIPGITGTYGREYFMDFPQANPIVRVIQTSAGLTFEDGRWNYNAGDSHYTWLSDAIDGGRARGVRWTIVTSHLPCMSMGVYTCSSNAFTQLLVSKKVDLVLHGHEHSYMRTHQLRSGVAGCTTLTVGTANPNCIADADDVFTAGQGTVFATVGTAGINLRDVNLVDGEAGYFAAASGLNANPTYGLLDLSITETQLAANFVGTTGGTFTDAFTVTVGPPPSNEPPIASFTAQVTDRSVAIDGSGSTDSDGFVVAHEWDFGDGATASGVTPAPHAYTAAGTYVVTLTVQDDDGASGSTTRTVTVTDPPGATLASDAFNRTVTGGWGAASTGGTWTVAGASAFSVDGAEGLISVPAGTGRSAYLRAITSDRTDVLTTLGLNKVATGSGFYASVVGRSVIGAGDYRSTVRFRSDGRVSLVIRRMTATGVEVNLSTETVATGLTAEAGSRFRTRLQVTGTGPTTVRAKVWRVGTAEPATWLLSATDSTAGLQTVGSPGLAVYLSGGATNAPITFAVDDLSVTRP